MLTWQRVEDKRLCIELESGAEASEEVDAQSTVNAQARREVHHTYLEVCRLNIPYLEGVECINGYGRGASGVCSADGQRPNSFIGG